MYSISSLITRTDVTCVRFCNNNVLAGIGGKLSIYDENFVNTKTITVFKGQQIFGIVPNSIQTELLIYGENQLKILSSDNDYEEIASFIFDDWTLSAKWINSDNNIATVSMNNNISLWSKDLHPLQTVMCEERCILYSAHLVNDVWEDLIVLSGTVFSQILLWRPVRKKVLARLNGHKGVIFSIDYNPLTGVICSTSDDRSAMLWAASIEEIELEDPVISHKCTLFCHTARVFRCLVLENCVLTAGEDSLIVVWNFNGEIVRRIELHQGAAVWSLDYNDTNNLIVTGGGDGGISLFTLQQNLTQEELPFPNNEVLKRIVIVNDGSIVTISESGILFLYQGGKWIEVYKHEDLVNYSLLEVSRCRNFLALAGYRGSVHIYKSDLALLCSGVVANGSRIFALHWLTSNQILTCASGGVLQTWLIENNRLILQSEFILPPSKERWTTCASVNRKGLLTVGDRKGNIYIFSHGSCPPIQIIKKAHNYLGVTNVYFKQDALISLGRNSVVKRYQFEEESGFATLSANKLPFAWLTAIYDEDDREFLLAFLGDSFVVWDYKRRRTLLQIPCGGGHRSWDFNKIRDTIKFAFIKDKNIHVTRLNSKDLDVRDLCDGFHVNEINSVFCFTNNYKTLVVSGGEDTTLRVSTIDTKFLTKNIFKSHLSSIRSITGCKINSDEFLVFSAGGRAQVILWQLKILLGGEKHEICEKHSHYEQSEESESRIMDLCTIVTSGQVILIAVTSSGTLKIFLISNQNRMELLGEVVYKLKCILKVQLLTICRHSLILSTATDGNVVFWNFTKLVSILNEPSATLNSLKDVVNEISIVKNINVHPSGINSLHYKTLDGGRCVLVTGGDDNAIKVNLLNFGLRNDILDVEVLSSFTDTETHCAQVTGAYIDDDYLITTSIDQKLNVRNWKINNDIFIYTSKQVFYSDITDIQGMNIWKTDNEYFVLVYGKGIELFKINGKCDNLCNRVFK
ncbi:hypothetical protein FQR65_LT06132 [Abscondita terminalis]|nr:hypothetical protein FQR65_LT06132 [Abscondita terminalis]